MAEKRLSADAVAAATASETAAVFVTLVTINVDGDAVLHVCDDKQAITSQGTEFIPCGFTALLPDQSEGGNKSCRLSIDKPLLENGEEARLGTDGRQGDTSENR